MKRLIMALVMAASLSGCAGEFQREAGEMSNQDLLNYASEFQPECKNLESAYQANMKEIKYRESMGHMNAQDDAQALAKAAQACTIAKQQEANREALKAEYEASHPQPSMMDDLTAIAECNNNPVICRAHIVSGDLDKVGW